MEENTNAQVNQNEAAKPVEKVGLFGRVKRHFKKEKTPATPDGAVETVPKKTFGQKIKDNKGKIIAGVATAGAVTFAVLKMAANAKSEGEYDPDMETEPGDWEPDEFEEDSGETSEEEVTEE